MLLCDNGIRSGMLNCCLAWLVRINDCQDFSLLANKLEVGPPAHIIGTAGEDARAHVAHGQGHGTPWFEIVFAIDRRGTNCQFIVAAEYLPCSLMEFLSYRVLLRC